MTNRFGWTVACLLLVAPAGLSEEWPGWRGPRSDGTSTETGLPLHWGKSENIRWKVLIPGKGHSSPIVWGNRIFLTTCTEDSGQRLLLCLDRSDGKVVWQREVIKSRLEAKHALNSYASATPATDGKHIWVTFLDAPDIQIACYDFDGNLVWRRSPGSFQSIHGFCSSPVLYRDMVILNGDQDAEAWIVALDQATGAERWRTNRPNRTRSYCTPLLIDVDGKKQLVLSGSKCVAGYDPDSGRQLWIVDGPTEQFVASLVYTEGVVFVTGGFPTLHVLGIRPDGSGNVTQTHVLWHETRGAGYVPSPIANGHCFFLVTDGGLASCLDAKTGKRHWMERLGRHHSASPVSAGGYLYFTDDDGTTWVLKADPTFQVVSRNTLGEECIASPAVAHGQLFLRTRQHLWCIGNADRRARRSD
jgi:outer membrane protein assembly factor BamB